MKFNDLVELFLEAKKMKKVSKETSKKSKKVKTKKEESESKEGGYDVNKDGKIEGWEAARSKAIAKNMKKK